MWVEKYKPKNFREVKGDKVVLDKFKTFILNFKKNKKKGIMLYGPVGSGKTCMVYALAKDINFEVVEVNASDCRNKEGINKVVGGSINQMSLFSKGKLILIDDVDGLSGTKDRGGIQALTELIKGSYWPIILTCNDPWDKKFSNLRGKTELLEIKSLDASSVFNVLINICKEEGITHEDKMLKELARTCGSDLRGAIHNLQTVCSGKKNISKGDLEVLGEREKEVDIFNAMRVVFKTREVNVVLNAFNNVDMNLNEIFLWLDENLPLEYRGVELSKAYENLSKADIFNKRIKRWQYYRFLVYVNTFMSVGVALSKGGKKSGFVPYKRSNRILKIWRANMTNKKRSAIAQKIGEETHNSNRKILKDFEFLKFILKNNLEICKNLDLSEDEISWLKR